MKKYLLLLITLPLLATTIEVGNSIEEKDLEALRTFVKERRQQVRVSDKGGQLTIAGDLRTEYQCRTERLDGIRQYAPGAASNVATNQFDIDVNFQIDYRTDRTWGQFRLRFDNDMGTVSGSLDGIAMVRCFLGGRLVNGDDYTINLEVGRKPFGLVFDSRIEFASLMDGVLISYDHGLDSFGDVYIHGGPFLINDKENQFGVIAELGVLNLFKTGLYLKYSIIDWDTADYSDPANNDFRYLNSQIVAGWRARPSWLNNSVVIYSGWLINHAAKGLPITDKRKANKACYIGFQMGQAKSQGDWSFEINYQLMQAQAVLALDSSGIGNGNPKKYNFYTAKTQNERIGAGNYQGFEINYLYMLTDNITVFQSYQQSVSLNDKIGPQNFYRLYELELVYAF